MAEVETAAQDWVTLNETGGHVLLATLALIAASGLVWLMLNAPGRPERRRDVLTDALTALGWVLLPVWFLLLAGTLWHLWMLFDGRDSFLKDTGFGMGAVVAAFLGGPFVIWGAVLKHRTVEFQKEGHITERISKAVEQLGAEKTASRIGRPVTIWTGQPKRLNVRDSQLDEYRDRPRTKVGPPEWEQTYNEKTEDVEKGYWYDVTTWPEERRVIEWRDTPVNLAPREEIVTEGDWQAFEQTRPNIEVRIGGLLSLERIAQDSTRYDKGRDHVRVMEILCAYVRENAPADKAPEFPFPQGCKQDTLEEKRKATPTWLENELTARSDI